MLLRICTVPPTACLGVPVLVLVVIAGIAKKKMLQKAEGKAAG